MQSSSGGKTKTYLSRCFETPTLAVDAYRRYLHLMVTRRSVLQTGVAAAVYTLFGKQAKGEEPTTAATQKSSDAIDRHALVSRHNVHRNASRAGSPLQVGNGSIAMGADITGVQSFVGFNILSQWGWHTSPLPRGKTLADMKDALWPSRDRAVPYDSGDPNEPAITEWAFENPVRINLGRIGLKLLKRDGSPAHEKDLTETHQELDLWTGTLHSHFSLEGDPVQVTTVCHPIHDSIAVRVESPAVAQGRVSAYLDFPAPDDRQFADSVGTWAGSGRIPTTITAEAANRMDLLRQMDDDRYHIGVIWHKDTKIVSPKEKQPATINIDKARYGAGTDWLDVTAKITDRVLHGNLPIVANNETFGPDPAHAKVKRLEVTYTIQGVQQTDRVNENGTWRPSDFGTVNCFRLTGSGDAMQFAVAFSLDPIPADLPDAAATFTASQTHWPDFWNSGGAIDLSQSADPRWKELERRIVLSQYLMAVNEAGDLPPQESGLVNTGWFGKFHMEMYWWHAAHYALWNRWPLLDRSSGIYTRMLESAKARAKTQGYKGARWTKMTGPDGRNSAYVTNALLAWQEPHPMFFAELEYRARPAPQTLSKWQTVLFETADFMASFAQWNELSQHYDLGPSMALVSENTDPKVTRNPSFELAYWRFGLRIAQTWRERLKLPRDESWDKVLKNLAPLPVADGVYVTYEDIPDMWTHYNFEHPALTGIFGWLPGDGVDQAVMKTTFEKVQANWRMNKIWGWDFPMMAMCAARLGEPEKAVDLLLTPGGNFGFDDAGFATGGPFPYFPSNGGLLYAIALMTAGWDGSPKGKNAPGFPEGKQWVVKSEGLSRAI